MPNPGAMTVLQSNPIFGGLAPARLAEIVELCSNRRYAPGNTIFRQGELGTTLFGVIAGQIRITVTSPEGQELHLNLIEPGEVVGEIAFLDGGQRTATGTAATATTCFAIQRKPFYQLLDRRPEIRQHLLLLLCERVRWTSRLVADSAFLSVPDRLTRRLADLLPAGEQTSGNGVRIKISQLELATYLGVSRQVVNGYLRQWQEAGRLQLGRGAITISDPQWLMPMFAGDQPGAPRNG